MNEQFFVSNIPYWPSIEWYKNVIKHQYLHIPTEPYNRQLGLNKTTLAGSNGAIELSVPLQGGRNQRTNFDEVYISYEENWSYNHLRTIQSCYGRSPFYMYLEPLIAQLYNSSYTTLQELNTATFNLINKFLKQQISIEKMENGFSKKIIQINSPLPYTQVFDFKNGFIPNCSMLDLICNEGKNSLSFLK